MKKIFTRLTLLSTIVLVFSQCNKKDVFTSEPVQDYLSLQVGKYIIYRLDSMKFVNLDTVKVSYQAKDEVDGTLTDNLGRPGVRVVRYLRDVAGTQPWRESMTYMVLVDKGAAEVTENNFRYIKLQQPINEGFSWKGNHYISLYSSDPDWDYRFLDNWEYFYENAGQPYNTLSGSVENTITVNQRDEELGYPNDPLGYSERNRAFEVYGKGIGLVYKDFLHMQYQPANGGLPAYRLGFSIKLNMLSHN